MLKYLITGTESLAAAGVLIGLLTACTVRKYGNRARMLMTAAAVLGFAAAVVMAYMKNKTKFIDTGAWNLRIFALWLAAMLLFLITDLRLLRKKIPAFTDTAAPLFAAVMAFLIIFYALPDILAYPYTFVLGGESVLSTGFLYRLIGLVLGVLLAVLAGLAAWAVSMKAPEGLLGAVLKTALVVNGAQYVSKIIQTLLTRRIISGRTLFKIVKFTSNHGSVFTFIILLLAALLPLFMFVKTAKITEPYENPAQLRKLKANRRSIRRWSATVLLSFFIAVMNMTAVKAYANRPVELSPTEECEVRGDNVYVSFEQVEDGHLHRFAYTTEKGKAVRFIIIKKPNSSAYGVGLDACDICGETGYFERNGQIVCKLCDVVMNINTIGFKGGCNPKVIDYSIENGHIVIPTYTLIEHEGDFK